MKVNWMSLVSAKGADLRPLVATVRTRLRAAVVIGAEPDRVLAALEGEAPGVSVVRVPDGTPEEVMEGAVRAAGRLARPGDTVMLAPAAASWDQFRSYAQRGDLFAAAAARLVEAAGKSLYSFFQVLQDFYQFFFSFHLQTQNIFPFHY